MDFTFPVNGGGTSSSLDEVVVDGPRDIAREEITDVGIVVLRRDRKWELVVRMRVGEGGGSIRGNFDAGEEGGERGLFGEVGNNIA